VFGAIWRDAAAELGAELDELSPGLWHIRRGHSSTHVFWHMTPLDDPVTLRLALDKPLVHGRLAAAGLPVPDHREVELSDLGAAIEFLERGAPCVVKVAGGASGGEGTTAGVSTRADLSRARLKAARAGGRILLERQIDGDMYRVLLLDGRLVDAVRRHPPRVIGDGRSTVAELIASENRRRFEADGRYGLRLLRVDLDAVLRLERAGLSLAAVPAPGEAVAVKTVTSQNRIEDNETARDELAPELAEECAAAAAAVGLRLAGVDLITPDAGRPLGEADGAIIEVNGTPGLHYHYQVAEPARATRVGVPVLEQLLR
jgi:D-alanine-D-alanine ligase-like ATP-grasp enzyme